MPVAKITYVVGMAGAVPGAAMGILVFGVLGMLVLPLAPLFFGIGVAIGASAIGGAVVVRTRPRLGGALLLLPVPIFLYIALHTIFFQNPNGGGGIFLGPSRDLALLGVPTVLLTMAGSLALLHGCAPRGSKLAAPDLTVGHAAATLAALVTIVFGAIAAIEPDPKIVRGDVSNGRSPLRDARVEASIRIGHVPWKPARYEVSTDRDGRFELALPPGRYEFRVSHPDHEEYRRYSYVMDKGVMTTRFVLNRKMRR